MRLSMGMSRSSVAEARRAVEAYRDSFDGRLDELCRRLAQRGMEVAVTHVPVDTGDLRSSIHTEARGDGSWLVAVRNGHAAFVEFGTGVVGQGTYEGELPAGWSYDQRRTPEAHDALDPTIWYYRDPVDGAVRSTRGRRAAHYMLRASESMRREATRIAREVWR